MKEFIDEDFLSKENNIRGGVRDRDENEFTVFPINLLSFIVITFHNSEYIFAVMQNICDMGSIKL